MISPEGCAAILWKVANDETNRSAADALHLTAAQNLKNGLIDDVVPEPLEVPTGLLNGRAKPCRVD